MTFLQRLFRPAPVVESTPPAPISPTAVVAALPERPIAPVSVPDTAPAVVLPDWLSDEKRLRDEGVIFGLSDARPEEKTAVIRTCFIHLAARTERQIEQYTEKIGELNLFIEQRENQIGELDHRRTVLQDQQPATHQLPRTITGLLLSVGMCIGNYFLIEQAIRPAYPTQTVPIALGVFLAGMFGLFNRTSLFHDPASRPSVRRVAEEVALPVVSAGFVWAMAAQHQSVAMASALGLFVLGLFLFGGKLLLGLLTVLRDDWQTHIGNGQLKRDQQTRVPQYEAEANNLRREIDELRTQKWQILPDLSRAEAERDRLNARRDMLIRLFESEFNLARSVKEQLSDEQRNVIFGK